jgi:hypothetical protein
MNDDISLDGIPTAVVAMFEQLASRLLHEGHKQYSARAIMHRIRWHYTVEKGDRSFKCNNNWTPRLSRRLMHDRPEFEEFFEIRASPSRHDMTDYHGPYQGKAAP